MFDIESLFTETLSVLQTIIGIPSVSKYESPAADYIEKYLQNRGASPKRHINNVWAVGTFLPTRPTLLLNAHIDTVRPAEGWTLSPFDATWQDDRLYGLGSNDCGGGLCTLMQVFLALKDDTTIPWNLVYLASAEEEISGFRGIEAVLPALPHINVALVGEPTGMHPAIAEKGLMVLDCTAHGKSGHAARNEGINAIYKAIADIQFIQSHRFERVSPLLGPVKATVTMIEAGTQHNVIPDTCRFVVDVRSNECYSNAELLDFYRNHLEADVRERSTRLNSSSLSPDHPLVRAAVALGRTPFGSPTLSDQALMSFPSFKMGPGNSARSHTADEFITKDEIHEALNLYLRLLTTPLD